MSERVEKIRARLQSALAPTQCQIEDESAKHAGHAGAASGGGHYRVHLVASAFEGKRRIDRHRLVYDAVQDMMHTEIHALAINAVAPSEL